MPEGQPVPLLEKLQPVHIPENQQLIPLQPDNFALDKFGKQFFAWVCLDEGLLIFPVEIVDDFMPTGFDLKRRVVTIAAEF